MRAEQQEKPFRETQLFLGFEKRLNQLSFPGKTINLVWLSTSLFKNDTRHSYIQYADKGTIINVRERWSNLHTSDTSHHRDGMRRVTKIMGMRRVTKIMYLACMPPLDCQMKVLLSLSDVCHELQTTSSRYDVASDHMAVVNTLITFNTAIINLQVTNIIFLASKTSCRITKEIKLVRDK